jgi:hypothetical protein
MPTIRMSAEVREQIRALLRSDASLRACVAIHKNGPRADLMRKDDGTALWSIERPGPWGAHLMSADVLAPSDVVTIDGVPFYFAVLDREKVPVLELSVVDGKPYVHIAN